MKQVTTRFHKVKGKKKVKILYLSEKKKKSGPF